MNLSCKVVPDQGDGVRVGFAISKSAGKAVTRNRIRRRLREALKNCEEINTFKGSVLLSARPSSLSLGFTELESELCELLSGALARQGQRVLK